MDMETERDLCDSSQDLFDDLDASQHSTTTLNTSSYQSAARDRIPDNNIENFGTEAGQSNQDKSDVHQNTRLMKEHDLISLDHAQTIDTSTYLQECEFSKEGNDRSEENDVPEDVILINDDKGTSIQNANGLPFSGKNSSVSKNQKILQSAPANITDNDSNTVDEDAVLSDSSTGSLEELPLKRHKSKPCRSKDNNSRISHNTIFRNSDVMIVDVSPDLASRVQQRSNISPEDAVSQKSGMSLLPDESGWETLPNSSNKETHSERVVFNEELDLPSKELSVSNEENRSPQIIFEDDGTETRLTAIESCLRKPLSSPSVNEKSGKSPQEAVVVNNESASKDSLPNCPFCGAQESDIYRLEFHIGIAHPETSFDVKAEMDGAKAGGRSHNGHDDLQYVCPLCDADLEDRERLYSHIAVAHPDDDSELCESLGLCCPLCDARFSSEDAMSAHVKTHMSDETYFGVSVDSSSVRRDRDPGSLSVDSMVCPVCGHHFSDLDLLNSHVESHFSPSHSPGVASQQKTTETETSDKENLPSASGNSKSASLQNKKTNYLTKGKALATKSPSKASASTSSSSSSSSITKSNGSRGYRRQYEKSLQNAVMRGNLSVSEYHEQRTSMAHNTGRGVDDGHSRTQGLIERLTVLYSAKSRPGQKVFVCSPTDHFAGSHGDKGWGCGYRNLQMMLSCLVNDAKYARKIFTDGRESIPSIPAIQQMIETAWRNEFDRQGCAQLGGRLTNTKKWIGATEIVATLSALGVKCRLVDFHAPTGPDGTHPRLFEWVTDYFSVKPQHPEGILPPLYLQHQGHSRTIVGVERDRDVTRLLIFDPGAPVDQMSRLARAPLEWKDMRTFRRTMLAFRSKQYQIVAVAGLLTDAEYQESKILRSERVS